MRTRLSSGLTATSLGLLLIGFAARSWLLVLLALPPLVFLAVGALLPPPVPVVAASRTTSRDRLQVEGEVDVRLEVRNEGPSLDLVEILDVLPPAFDVVRGTNHVVLPLPAGGAITLSYVVRPRIKGDYTLGPVRIRATDPLSLALEDAEVALASRIAVAPVVEDVRRAKLSPLRTRPWFGQVVSRQRGVGTEFWSVRDYLPGDDVRRINWKATARLDRILSNEYEGERSGDVVIILDARRESFVGTEEENSVEAGVRAALGIAEHVLASKNRVGLVVQRDVLDWVYPAFGRKQLYRILDALIRVRAGGEWDLAHVAWVLERFFPPDALVVVISPLVDRTSLDAVVALAARGHDVTVVSPSPLVLEAARDRPSESRRVATAILSLERDNLIAQLRRVAKVVDWHPDVPLALSFRRWEPSPRPA